MRGFAEAKAPVTVKIDLSHNDSCTRGRRHTVLSIHAENRDTFREPTCDRRNEYITAWPPNLHVLHKETISSIRMSEKIPPVAHYRLRGYCRCLTNSFYAIS